MVMSCTDDSGLASQQVLQMQQGDLLVCAATLLHGVNHPPHAQSSEYQKLFRLDVTN